MCTNVVQWFDVGVSASVSFGDIGELVFSSVFILLYVVVYCLISCV